MKDEYSLYDSGNKLKLEQLGEFRLIRSSPLSDYPTTKLKLWEEWDAKYTKNDRGSGEWSYRKKIPASFTINYADIKFLCKLTPFGHIGLFPEQKFNWDRIRSDKLAKPGSKEEWEVLNLFAYSGGSTMACLQAGMKVCHLDASKGMVEWARENAKLNQLDKKPVRWIVEDVTKFLKREINRGKKYSGFILDPPSFGRGSKGEVFKIEEDLGAMLDQLMVLCDSKPKFIILTCHSQGYSSLSLEKMIATRIKNQGTFESSELWLDESHGGKYPAGSCCFFTDKNL